MPASKLVVVVVVVVVVVTITIKYRNSANVEYEIKERCPWALTKHNAIKA
jgi:hypothetical protein